MDTNKQDSVSEILKERKSTHGNFSDNSTIAQRIKEVMRATPNWHELLPYEKEAIEMIAHKLGRIGAGDPHYPDHWMDIDGYLRLTADLNKEIFNY
jgi:hypothetical protein